MMSRFARLCFGLAVLSTLTPTPGLGQTVATVLDQEWDDPSSTFFDEH